MTRSWHREGAVPSATCATDPTHRQRIEDSQENIRQHRGPARSDRGRRGPAPAIWRLEARAEQAIIGLQAQPEVVAAEGLVIDRVRTDRLLVDPAIEDISGTTVRPPWMVEKIPMQVGGSGLIPRPGPVNRHHVQGGRVRQGRGQVAAQRDQRRRAKSGGDDPLVLAYEVWNKTDNTIYTLVDGVKTQFARAPYQPQYAGERWWPYFLLPFQSVDGVFVSQSLVDAGEAAGRAQRDPRQVRRVAQEHRRTSSCLVTSATSRSLRAPMPCWARWSGGHQRRASSATSFRSPPSSRSTRRSSTPARSRPTGRLSPAAGRRAIDRHDPEDRHRGQHQRPVAAARVAEFRDQVEDWLTEIAQYSSELCLLAMGGQVQQIMGTPEQPDQMTRLRLVISGILPAPEPTYASGQRSARPESVFSPDPDEDSGRLHGAQQAGDAGGLTKALPLIREMVMMIRQIDATMGDSTPERELSGDRCALRRDDRRGALPAPKPAPMPAPAVFPRFPAQSRACPCRVVYPVNPPRSGP